MSKWKFRVMSRILRNSWIIWGRSPGLSELIEWTWRIAWKYGKVALKSEIKNGYSNKKMVRKASQLRRDELIVRHFFSYSSCSKGILEYKS
jgi:hypothetical protein